MADGYDRFENEGGGGGSFVMGLLTGTVLGAGLGMLFAPKSGSELRNQLSLLNHQVGAQLVGAGEPAREVVADMGDDRRASRGREEGIERRDAVRLGRRDGESLADVVERPGRDPAEARLHGLERR